MSGPAATLAELFLRAAAREPDAVALRQPRGDGDPLEISYGELGRSAHEIARGLAALGIAPGDRVALLADTRPEWTLADAGIAVAAATTVPVYHTSSPEECRYVLAHSGARAILCEDAGQVAKIAQVRSELPALEHVVVLLGTGGDGVLSLAELRLRGAERDAAEIDARLARLRPDDPATIVYTSGTTGPPKGCVLTHRNWLAAVQMYAEQVPFGERPVVFLFLPLAHSLARVAQLVTLDIGGTLAFWSGDARRVMDDVATLRPTHLPVVPRILEKIHARVLDAVEQADPLRRHAFRAALSLGRRHAAARRRATASGRMPPALLTAHRLADRFVLASVREVFGDRLEQLLVGAAPVGPEVLAFFEACGVTVLEGYGLTETCAAATLNVPEATRLGTAGRPLPGVEVRIASDGEVLLRGPNVFLGYYENEAATREALDEHGWLRTGDLGTLDDGGFLRITGRTKDLIITSSGKNVTPSNLEAALREVRWISQAVAFGDRRPYLVALLTLDPDELPALARCVGHEDGAEAGSLAADPRVRALLDAEVAAVNARFARIEQIKRFGILDHDFSQAAGELTPTLKLKRNVVYDRYADDFAQLYEAP
ncbi:MAG: AMP-dependent synthetase/ligase [Conexibacter sp.]